MLLSHKPFEELVYSDLEQLVRNAVSESRRIDYKRTVVGGRDRDKTDFVRDVVSFANTDGGFIIFGVTEKGGVPKEINGLNGVNADAEILRLEEMVRTGVRPQIFGISCRAIFVAGGAPVIVVRIPRSWAAPHVVVHGGEYRFWARSSNGKYRMEVEQIGEAFLEGQTVLDRIREFTRDRLTVVPPISTMANRRLMIHAVPLTAFRPAASADLGAVAGSVQDHPCFRSTPNDWRFNFDGFVGWRHRAQDDPMAREYTQFFRNGAVEGANCSIAFKQAGGRVEIEEGSIDPVSLNWLERYVAFAPTIGVIPPVVVAVSLVDCFNVHIVRGDDHVDPRSSEPIDRADLTAPEVLLESFEQDLPALAKPAFDAIWNASGRPSSPFYDNQGGYLGPGR